MEKVDSNNRPVLVACATDSRIVGQVSTMLRSVISNTRRQLKIFIFCVGVSEEAKRRVQNELTGTQLNWIELELPDGLSIGRFHISNTTFARILMPATIRSERFVYLDIDLVIRSDIGALYDLDLGSCPIGAVYETTDSTTGKRQINAGVLVMDPVRWNALGLTEKLISYATQRCLKNGDQDAINAIVPSIAEIESRWNSMRYVPESVVPISERSIIHFIGPLKPWTPLAFLFLSRGYMNEWKKYGGTTEWSFNSIKAFVGFILGLMREKFRSALRSIHGNG